MDILEKIGSRYEERTRLVTRCHLSTGEILDDVAALIEEVTRLRTENVELRQDALPLTEDEGLFLVQLLSTVTQPSVCDSLPPRFLSPAREYCKKLIRWLNKVPEENQDDH